MPEKWKYYPVAKMNRLTYHSFSNFPLMVENHVGLFRDWFIQNHVDFLCPIKTKSCILFITGKAFISLALKPVGKNIVFPEDGCPIKVLWDQSHDERLVASTWRDWEIHSLGMCDLN